MPGVSVCTKSFIVAMELLNYFPTFKNKKQTQGSSMTCPKSH